MPDDLYVGLISGTSTDGIDAALVSFNGKIVHLHQSHLHPLPSALRERLISLFTPASGQLDLMGELDSELGTVFAEAALALLNKAGVSKNAIKAIGSHGQTIRHRPELKHPFTLQIGDPNRIAELTGINVVADFRRKDMACGGQGAPLAPAFHQAFLGNADENRVVLNIGGIANITYLPANGKPAIAMDTGPGNGLMDAWISEHKKVAFDKDGLWARSGQPAQTLLDAWLDDPYFSTAPPKSTGKEYFHLEWAQRLAQIQAVTPSDVQASFLELTAQSITASIKSYCAQVDKVLVCGGGAFNSELMKRLSALLPCPVVTTQAEQIPPDWVEAMAFAWFAMCHCENIALDLSAFTGSKKPRLIGGFYPA